MDIQAIASLLAIISFIYSTLKRGYNFLYNYLITPRVKWGFLDCPNAGEAHYFVIAESKWSKKAKQNVRFVMTPVNGRTIGYHVIIANFFSCIGSEHLKEELISDITPEVCIDVLYELTMNTPYRIIIKVPGGTVGSLPCDNYNFNIETPESKTKEDHHKLPFKLRTQ